MANILKTLIPLLTSTTLLLAVAKTAQSQSTSFSYNFTNEQSTGLTLQGDAYFPKDFATLRLIKLIDGMPLDHRTGRVLYTTPVQFSAPGAQLHLQTTVNFTMIRNVNEDSADGLVFFIAPVGTTVPKDHSGGNLGVFESYTAANPSVFAVEVDIHVNNEVDPKYTHIGIDIEYLKSVNTTKATDGMFGGPVTLVVEYDGGTRLISVQLFSLVTTYEVTYVSDLSTVLNQQVQVGIAAATGSKCAFYHVSTWNFNATLVKKVEEEDDIKIRQYV